MDLSSMIDEVQERFADEGAFLDRGAPMKATPLVIKGWGTRARRRRSHSLSAVHSEDVLR